ncbi:MAG: hypothetical protein NZM16_05680, partial [Thermoflexus sp.]|uniref:hypothetical protein n=1 Tax=Thermoflexus sp. TaxID=1969742 RepID=UPI0025D574E6
MDERLAFRTALEPLLAKEKKMSENTWPKSWEGWLSPFRWETRSERYYSAHYVMHRLQLSGYAIFPGPEQSDFAIYLPPPRGPAWILFRHRAEGPVSIPFRLRADGGVP